MKRLSVLGLCLVAAFAFTALVASSAMATKTEHGELFVLSSGGASHLGTPKATITSTANSGSGHITSATGGTAITKFFNVEIETTGFKCTSAGQASGVVETKLLSEETGW